MNKKNEYQDEGLKGNERIEDAIFALQKEATQEQLAHTLTVIRRRMKEGGQLIVAVEPDPAQAQLKLQTVRPGSNRAKYCPECAARMKRINAAKRKRKQREKCHALGAEKPL